MNGKETGHGPERGDSWVGPQPRSLVSKAQPGRVFSGLSIQTGLMNEEPTMSDELHFPRRTFLKGAAGAGLVVAAGGGLIKAVTGIESPAPQVATAGGRTYTEVFPTSPLIGGTGVDGNGKAIGSTFVDPLPIPKALAPVPKEVYSGWKNPPGPGLGQQNSFGNEQHQIWPGRPSTKTGQLISWNKAPLPDPIVYQIKIEVDEHAFTSSDRSSRSPRTASRRSRSTRPVSRSTAGVRSLPQSTIYGFNGTFPGPMINAEYGKPVLVRFENHLDENPLNLDRQDFGAPDWLVPHPPAQRAHRARERRQPALPMNVRPEGTRLTGRACGATTCT